MHGFAYSEILLDISRPGVGVLKANELIKQGLVTKTPDPDDRRKNYLTVNEEAVPQYKIYRYQDNEAVRRITEKYSGEEDPHVLRYAGHDIGDKFRRAEGRMIFA